MIILVILKFIISGLLLVWVLAKIDWNLVSIFLGQMLLYKPLLALLLTACGMSFSSLRQYFVFRSMGFSINLKDNHTLTWRGAFLNQILPGGIGGDAYRILKLTKNKFGKTRLASAVFWDRVLGFLFIVIFTSLSFALEKFPNSINQEIIICLSSVWLLIIAAISLSFLPNIFQNNKLKHLVDFLRFGKNVFTNNTFYTFLCSVVSTLFICASFFTLTTALNLSFSFAQSILWCGLCILVTIVPISVSGWGIREGMLIVSFKALGIPFEQATLLGVAFGLIQLVTGLIGGLCFFTPLSIK